MDDIQLEKLYNQIDAALLAGDMKTFVELSKKAPMPPEVAKAIKYGAGAEALRTSGYNLSAAEAKYGKDWLDR